MNEQARATAFPSLRMFDPGVAASGGKRFYGVVLGFMALDSRFPRIPGDGGNASTWPFPVEMRLVTGASPGRVVRGPADDDLIAAFIDAARELTDHGVSLITTSCGFLARVQDRLQAAVDVPVFTSSLMQVPWVLSGLPRGQTVAVMTIERASLTQEHLRGAGVTEDMPVIIGGMDDAGGYFTGQILGDRGTLDFERARDEHIELAMAMVTDHPDIGAFVLECTNMPPYADAISRATGRPVYDVTTMVGWAVSAARRSPFRGYL